MMFSFVTVVVLSALLFQSGAPGEIATLKGRAEEGDSRAQVKVGIAYASGNGVPANDAEAVKWFQKAAGNGNASGEYSLGEMYLSGRGVPASVAEGVKWMRRAAE